uniref:Cupin type-1 domain-containing protein n=1 Tax=Oryza barthii TaxID=65489 RepID=A0A0D3HRL1_9ORYZ
MYGLGSNSSINLNMASSNIFLLIPFIALVATQAMASDPSPLQDFCVADKNSPVRVNGFPCKDAKDVSVDDFFLAANLDKPMDTTKSKAGSNVTLINVMKLAGLNTLGISMARIDYAPKGQNPPHTHPRATEILTVIEGSLYVGFVTSNQANGENKLFTKTLNKGDVFVFPEGLIQFQFNPSYDKPAAAIVALSSQNPGTITIANAVFGSNPPISDDVLAKAFQLYKKHRPLLVHKQKFHQLNMASSNFFLLTALIALVATQAMASDPSPLQDFCVADRNSPVRVNGFPCKDAKDVNVDDFFLAANLDKPMDTTKSKAGSNVTLINVMKLAGLNTLGISMARIDYAPKGQNPPHTHPRATEILTVLEGTLYVGFVTSNQANGENKLFTKTLNKGDVFVFPQGLIHFQFNPSYDKPAVAIAALSSQNPGASTIANAVFGSNPPISDDVLAKAFQVDKKAVDWLQAQFWENNHN